MSEFIGQEGFSVVTPTYRKEQLKMIIANYDRQRFTPKELIIIMNHDEMMEEDISKLCGNRSDIRFFRQPQSVSLGKCLNFGYQKARYRYIAKFDDDDYYGEQYLCESYDLFKEKQCDIVCKSSIFYYLQEFGQLIVIPRCQNGGGVARGGAGATICMSQACFQKIQYSDLRRGVDVDLFRRSRQQGITIYTSSSAHYMCIRGKDVERHTWHISSDALRRKADRSFGVRAMSLEEAYSVVSQKSGIS